MSDQIRVIKTLDPVWPVHFNLKEYLAYTKSVSVAPIESQQVVVVRTEEYAVPATIYTYRMHRLCKYRKCGCTGEDYIYKTVKREN